ncbi:MAG: hypothetical protein ACK59B_07425, partial [Alphaproteobacteria bacterium]
MLPSSKALALRLGAIAAGWGVIGARCDVAPVIADLTRALTRIYDQQGIAITAECAEGFVFRG